VDKLKKFYYDLLILNCTNYPSVIITERLIYFKLQYHHLKPLVWADTFADEWLLRWIDCSLLSQNFPLEQSWNECCHYYNSWYNKSVASVAEVFLAHVIVVFKPASVLVFLGHTFSSRTVVGNTLSAAFTVLVDIGFIIVKVFLSAPFWVITTITLVTLQCWHLLD